MNPLQTKPIPKDKVVDVRQVEVEKKQQLVGRILPKKGHTIWEVNLLEHTIEPAEFEEVEAASFVKEKPKGLGIVGYKDGRKKLVLDGLAPIKRKLIKKKDCIYMSKLNRKSVLKQLEKMGIIKIKKS